MAENRKPHMVFLLKKSGKSASSTVKIELFKADQWREKAKYTNTYGSTDGPRYRLRVNGKWYNYNHDYKYSFFTRYEVRDAMWRATKEWF